MSTQTNNKLFLHDHPHSSYTQKIRIALREKGIPFDRATPAGVGSGSTVPDAFAQATPRLQVPALEDGDLKIFDSTIILAYIEDKFPEHRLLPTSPAERAKARMIEDVCDNQFEALNWGYGELDMFDRATGDLREELMRQVRSQAGVIMAWLAEQLGEREYFNGDEFGYADLCVAPILHRAAVYGYGPADGSTLAKWHARISKRAAVKETFAEYEEFAKNFLTGGRGKGLIESGSMVREYRDHRLEWMIKSGGIDVVVEGLKKKNIRFSWPNPA